MRSAMTHRTRRRMIWAGGVMLLAALSTGMSLAQAPAQNSGGAQAGIKTIVHSQRRDHLSGCAGRAAHAARMRWERYCSA